jgi:hypothetical protein
MSMSTNRTTASSTFMQQFDDAKTLISRMEAAMQAVKPPQWVLIGPDGRVWQGTQRDVARALLQNIDVTTLFKDDQHG